MSAKKALWLDEHHRMIGALPWSSMIP